MSEKQEAFKIVSESTEGMSVEFDRDVYCLAAIKKAAYKFGDRFHILIQTNPHSTHVKLRAKKPLADLELLAGEFCNEVLDQELREQIALETEPMRNLLMAQAFSSTSLLDGEGDEADFREDPLGISQPSSLAQDRPLATNKE